LNKTYYRTVRIKNSGDTVVRYTFMNEEEIQKLNMDDEPHNQKRKVFSIREANGALIKNETKLMVIRFNPIEEIMYDKKQNCYLDYAYKNKLV